MSLRKCQCGAMVAGNARKCQGCGKRFTHPFAKVFAVLLVIAVIFAIAMQAKASSGDKATVYVYRYKLVMGSAYSPSVYCDDKQLARMDNGKYFAVAVDPGQHVFNSNDKQSRIALDVQPGRAYFIRLEISPGLWKGHGQLALVAPEQGRAELTSGKIKPLEQDKIFDHAAVSVAPVSFQPEAP